MIEREITYAIWTIMCSIHYSFLSLPWHWPTVAWRNSKNFGNKIKSWRIFWSCFSYIVQSLTICSNISFPSDVWIPCCVRLQKVRFHWLPTMGQHPLLTDFFIYDWLSLYDISLFSCILISSFFSWLILVPVVNRDELETYKELTSDTRVIILKALCEARADVSF